MDSFDKVNSSSTPSKLSASPMSSKSDENDQNYLPSIANLNPRKPREMEKIAEKKVLTERNEAFDLKFSENPSSDISNADPKPSSCLVGSGNLGNYMSQTTYLSSRVSDFDGDEENSLAAGFSSRPYDPLTNYLSPRPKFLRYKPSRRLEIFLRQQKDRVGEGNCGIGGSLDFVTTVGEDSLSVSTNSSSEEEETGKQVKEKLEESEGEASKIDEELADEGDGDKDRGWTVKELFKFLLIMASLVFSTSYITSMNTPTPSFEVSGAFRSGFCPILNHTGEFGLSLAMDTLSATGSNFWDEEVTEAASKRNSEGVSQFIHPEDAIGFMEETEILNGENEGKAVYGVLVKVEYTEQVEEVLEKPHAGRNIIVGMAEGEENDAEFSELIMEDDGDQEKGKESEISSTIVVPSEILEEDEFIKASKPSILSGFDQDNLLSGILTAAGNEYTPQMEGIEMEEAGDWKTVESNKGGAESFVHEASKITMLERITNSISSFGGITYLEDLEKLKIELIEFMHTETESVLEVVLGLSVSSAILTCLVLSFQFKKKKVDKKEPAISASAKPLLQSPVAEAEKIITRESPLIKPTCDVDRLNYESTGNVDSCNMLSSSVHSRDEVESFKEFYHHEAPTVQFLGELVVGEVSNSLKNKSGLKNRMVKAEDKSFSVSVEEKPVSKNMHSGPEQALSEFSTTSSPSYGSFTIKKKIVKKEVGGDGEVKLITTPVRRSTRIRNRIVSP